MYQKAMQALFKSMVHPKAPPFQWSVYFQTPDFLERTRMMLIAPEYEPLIGQWCGLRPGAKVLDVGCGTGFFTRLLKRVCPEAHLTGLELEAPFVERARQEAAAGGLAIDYLQGDALQLPFEDRSFDLVVSHTFLTSVPDPEQSFGEMKRVLRPGGRIASITAMNFLPSGFYAGDYPEECPWGEELSRLTQEVWTAYEKVMPMRHYGGGVDTHKLPSFFASQGMKNICAYPIGKLFSLSNAAVPTSQKERWLELYQRSEGDKLKAFLSLPEGREALSQATADRYLELIAQKCDYYHSHPEENFIWEWQGGANLLVTGDWGQEA